MFLQSSRIVQRAGIAAALLALSIVSLAPIARSALREGPNTSLEPAKLVRLSLRIAPDLDGDSRGDVVTLLSNGFDKTIRIEFGNSRNSSLSFTARSPDRGIVFAYDIDQDKDLDLIWAPSSGQKAAVVLINDGQGNFTPASDNTPYTSRLNSLLGDDDSNQFYSRFGCGEPILDTTSSTDIEPGTNCQLFRATIYQSLVKNFGVPNKSSIVLTYLRKRGPPSLA